MAGSLCTDGHLLEAVAWYAMAMERDPKFAGAYAGIADALFELERYDEAMEWLGQAESLLPASSDRALELQRLIAETHAAQDDAAAAAAYRCLLEQAPDNVPALNDLALLHFNEERYAQALDAL